MAQEDREWVGLRSIRRLSNTMNLLVILSLIDEAQEDEEVQEDNDV